MVTSIVERIGDELKRMNQYFDSYAINCFQLPNGEVVTKFNEEEMEDQSISDCKGIAFYIRIEPKATVQKKDKQFTSCETSYRARQTCHLVAYNFETKKIIDSDLWVNRLAKCLIGISFPSFKNNPSLQIASMNASYIDNFIEETKKQFNVTKYFNCVKVTFDVLYDVELQDCNFCDIYKKDC